MAGIISLVNRIPLWYFLDQRTQNFRIHLKPSCLLRTAVLFGSLKCIVTWKDKYCLLYSIDSFAKLFIIASIIASINASITLFLNFLFHIFTQENKLYFVSSNAFKCLIRIFNALIKFHNICKEIFVEYFW